MRALVTGATGLIGAQIVRALVADGIEVRCLVRPSSRLAALDGLPLQWAVADLADADAGLDDACAGCDIVFHTAAQFAYGGSDAAMMQVAVAGSERLLRACARTGVRRIVLTSSSVVFGHARDGVPVTEDAPLAASADEPGYVAAKIAQHRRAQALAELLDLDIRYACPTMAIGPTGSSLGPSNAMLVAYLADPFRSTYPGGCNLVAARDVAAGHLLIAAAGRAGESYLLGAQNLTWRQIHGMIAELAGVAPPQVELTHAAAFLAAAAEELRAKLAGRTALSTREQAGMVGRHYWYSHARAAALGYAPVPARAALVEAISWLAASPHVSRETRACMRLAEDIYRFRATATEMPA
ncbi:MAG: NAD-dependent epimerase/dehydratase family protein [Acetobacteraceae bacterium]